MEVVRSNAGFIGVHYPLVRGLTTAGLVALLCDVLAEFARRKIRLALTNVESE